VYQINHLGVQKQAFSVFFAVFGKTRRELGLIFEIKNSIYSTCGFGKTHRGEVF